MPSIPEEEARAAKGQQALHDWVTTQKKLATAGKRGPVTEKEIFDHAVEIAPVYRMGLPEKIEFQNKQVQEDLRKEKARKEQPKEQASKDRFQLEQRAQKFLEDNGQVTSQKNIDHVIKQGWVK